MRGVNLVVSTLIIIFVLIISCYGALAAEYGPKGPGVDPTRTGPNAMMFSPIAAHPDMEARHHFVQAVGGETDVLQVGFDSNGNPTNLGCTNLIDDAAATMISIPESYVSAVYLSLIYAPECDFCDEVLTTNGDYLTLVQNWVDQGCVGNKIVGIMNGMTENGAGDANLFGVAPPPPDFGFGSLDYDAKGPQIYPAEYIYVVPNTQIAETHIQNTGLVNTDVSFDCYEDCTLADTEVPYTLLPGQKISFIACGSYRGEHSTIVIRSYEEPVAVMVFEQSQDGMSLYNIYGGQGDDVFDSIAWATAPPGDLTGEVYIINPNSYDVSATLQTFRDSKNLDVYGTDVCAYGVEKLDIGDLNEISPTVLRARFDSADIPSLEATGNALLKVRGNSIATLEFLPDAVKQDVRYMYEPFFANNCELGDIQKTTINIYDNNNNNNKNLLTFEAYPWVTLNGWAPTAYYDGLIVEPFANLMLNSENMEGIPNGFCGSAKTTTSPHLPMCPEGETVIADGIIWTQASNGDFGLSWKTNVACECSENIDCWGLGFDNICADCLCQTNYGYYSAGNEQEQKEYGITGHAVNTPAGKPNYILAAIVLAAIAGIFIFIKSYKPKKPPVEPLQQKRKIKR